MKEEETNSKGVDVCNSLLRGEISAVQTYDQAISRIDSPEEKDQLKQFRASHMVSVKKLSKQVNEMGGSPSRGSGMWGAVANTYQATANIMGQDAAVNSLITGEAHGRKEYESALADPEMPDESKDLIRSELLPRTTENTIVLHELQAVN